MVYRGLVAHNPRIFGLAPTFCKTVPVFRMLKLHEFQFKPLYQKCLFVSLLKETSTFWVHKKIDQAASSVVSGVEFISCQVKVPLNPLNNIETTSSFVHTNGSGFLCSRAPCFTLNIF